jgi:hypothetical protein
MFSVHREGGLLVLQSLLADNEELFYAVNDDDDEDENFARHIPAECKDVLLKATDLLTDPVVHRCTHTRTHTRHVLLTPVVSWGGGNV